MSKPKHLNRRPSRYMWQRVQVALAIPYEHGHADVGQVLIDYAIGDLNETAAIDEINILILTYNRVK